jgi:hypothetical protein
MSIGSAFDKGFGIPLSGSYFAYNHLPRLQRAFLAADLHSGKCRLVTPMLTQAAAIARVNYTAAWWASVRQTERAAIIDGVMPLVPPRAALPASRTVSDTELADIIAIAGIERMLVIAAQVETDMKVAA